MTQPPPPPPNQPPQGTPQDRPPQQPQQSPQQPSAGPQDAPPPGFGAPQTPPSTPPAPPEGPQLDKAPGGPMPHQAHLASQPAQPGQPPQAAPPPTPPQPPTGPGYGYPQAAPPAGPPQPPTGPGYGYPQAAPPVQPPQPPTGPGYGYPGQPAPQGPPNPYGQQAAYGQQPAHPQQAPYGGQPGYGYPGQPTVPLHPQAGYPQPGQPGQPGYPGGYAGQPPTMPMHPQAGGGRKVNAQLAIIVAAVVAIALIIGGGVWYANSGDSGTKDDTASSGGTTGGDDKGGTGGTSEGGTSEGATEKAPADPDSQLLFKIPSPTVAEDDSVVVTGSWLTDKAYVKSGVAEIVGYDPDKGTELWTIKLPGPVCEASKYATEDDKTAVVFQPKMPAEDSSAGCTQVAAIDLAAGKQLWTKTVSSGDYPVTFDNVTVSAHTVALGATEGGAAFDIDTGKALWAPKSADTCYDAGYGGGPKLVAVRKCGDYDARTLHIQTIDPASGKVLSEYEMSTGIEYASVVSTDPLVIAADVGKSAQDGSGISDFFSVDNKTGKLITRISAPGDQFAARCDGITRIEHCTGIAVGTNRLYLPTEEHDGSGDYSQTNEIVAFDLTTGKQTGQRADAGDDYELFPLRMDGTDLIAYKRQPYDEGGQVISIDGGSFKQTKLMQNPSTEAERDAEAGMLPEYTEFIYSQGRLYMSNVYADDSSSGDEEYLALAYGTDG
ncbi:PQQ-binding-like beta-propeller repeat protein [Streptomyces sp. NPDC059894]|uniref:outer membrane protein assembly factor BamB family protein n=1 Tax=unclassified Streptomyces TaxID=2593676 RepID=UPI003663FC2B